MPHVAQAAHANSTILPKAELGCACDWWMWPQKRKVTESYGESEVQNQYTRTVYRIIWLNIYGLTFVTWSRFAKYHQVISGVSSGVINWRFVKFCQIPPRSVIALRPLRTEDTMESLAAKEAELTKEVPQLLETMFLGFSKISIVF